MQLEALKVFCDVARFRSFSQAAAANALTQPAATHIVHQLEKRLGVTLVDRSTRPLQLTPEGQAYFEGCRGLVERYFEVESAVRRQGVEVHASVQVAAIYSVSLRDMHSYVERFAADRPACHVHIEYLHPDRVYEKVLAGTADLGLVSFPKRSRQLVALPWREEEMVVACAPTHRLASRPSVELADLAGEVFVGFNRGLSIRREIDRLFREHGVALDVALEFDNIENIKRAVQVSGVALLPLPTLLLELRAGTIAAVRLSDVRPVRPLAIIHRRTTELKEVVRHLIGLLLQPDSSTPTPGDRPTPAGPRTAASKKIG